MSTKDVYAAENEVGFMLANGGTVEAYGSTFTLPVERKFGDLEGVQRYVNLIWQREGEGDPPTVRKRRGDAKAHYERGNHVIAVPDHQGVRSSWAMRELVILHELAHALSDTAGHGPEFCRNMIALVCTYIGAEAGFLLRAAMYERGVQLTTTVV